MATTFDTLKSRATKPLLAGVGVTDAVVGYVRGYATDVQQSVKNLDLDPAVLRTQATTTVNARVEAISKDAKARRTAIEKRVAELQADAKALPGRVQALVDDNLATATGAFGDLVSRGEGLVTRIRRQESTRATKAAAQTTTTKAKTTTTQAKKATKSTAKKATSTAKKTAAKKSAPAKSSAKATGTAAKKTAANAAQAVTDAAEKVGD